MRVIATMMVVMGCAGGTLAQQLHTLVLTGDALPGHPGVSIWRVTNAGDAFAQPVVNSAGHAAFTAPTRTTGGLVRRALMVHDGAAARVLAFETDPVPGIPGQTIRTIRDVHVADDGSVWAVIVTTTSSRAICRWRPDGTTSSVADTSGQSALQVDRHGRAMFFPGVVGSPRVGDDPTTLAPLYEGMPTVSGAPGLGCRATRRW